MQNLSIIILLLLYFNSSNKLIAQSQSSPAWKWAVNSNMIGSSSTQLVTDTAGNVYTAGYNLSKHSPNGILIWSKNLIDSSQALFTRGLSNDAAGNLYLTGYFFGTIVLDTATLTSYGHTDIFLAKLNSSGQVQWLRQAGSPGPPPMPMPSIVTEAAYGIAVDSVGGCYLTGICFPRANFGAIAADSATNNFVAKYDTQGNIQWVRAIPHEALGIALGSVGSYAVTGRAGNGTVPTGVYIAKYNSNGNLAWSKQGSGYSFGTSIAADPFGNFFITGYASNATTIDNFTILPPSNGSSMFLIKYNAVGSLQWGRQTSGNSCAGEHVVTDTQGNAYVTGGMTGTANFSGTTLNGINNGWQDIYAAKYTAGGNVAWALQAGSGGSDYGSAIGVLPSGDAYVTGSYQNNCVFGNINLTGNNVNNFFVAKILANPLGISANETDVNFQMYPNPGNSIISISGKIFEKGFITVYNTTGQEKYKAALQSGFKFSVETWPE